MQIGSYKFIVAEGDSMCPTLGEKAISILDLEDKDFKIGDVVVYNKTKKSDRRILGVEHRIIDEYNDFYQLKGDNNPFPDNTWIPKRKIIGKVVYNFDSVESVEKYLE